LHLLLEEGIGFAGTAETEEAGTVDLAGDAAETQFGKEKGEAVVLAGKPSLLPIHFHRLAASINVPPLIGLFLKRLIQQNLISITCEFVLGDLKCVEVVDEDEVSFKRSLLLHDWING
jgi:hypothetical protein